MGKKNNGIKSFRLSIYLWVLVILIIQPGCENCEVFGVMDLGNSYKLINADDSDAFLIYCTTERPCCNVGITLVPKLIDSIGFNSNYIIARSLSEDSTYYWIIEKGQFDKIEYDSGFSEKVKQGVLGPLDYNSFDSIIKTNDISIQFKSK